jgi:hypothetical protein
MFGFEHKTDKNIAEQDNKYEVYRKNDYKLQVNETYLTGPLDLVPFSVRKCRRKNL